MRWIATGFRRYVDFRGRSRRREFWAWTLFVWIGSTALWASAGTAAVAALLATLFSLGTLIPSLAVSVRRLHDTNRRGWWLLLPLGSPIGFFLIPLAIMITGGSLPLNLLLVSLIPASFVVLLVFFLSNGTPGPNRFVPDPKDRAGTADLAEIFR